MPGDFMLSNLMSNFVRAFGVLEFVLLELVGKLVVLEFLFTKRLAVV
jgi:hypothetical protein